jgi:hypothetical protein
MKSKPRFGTWRVPFSECCGDGPDDLGEWRELQVSFGNFPLPPATFTFWPCEAGSSVAEKDDGGL